MALSSSVPNRACHPPMLPQFRRAPAVLAPPALSPASLSHDGAFAGYASLFDVPDLSNDVIAPGAFAATLGRRQPQSIKLLFQHDPSTPIGVWQTLREDARGLYVEGQLTLDNSKARDVLALLRSGAIDGLSIGFKVITAARTAITGQRRLTRLDLWEISIVTFPMLPQAKISVVKNLSPPPWHGRILNQRTHSLSPLAAAIRAST
jgi:uncharacterized protein